MNAAISAANACLYFQIQAERLLDNMALPVVINHAALTLVLPYHKGKTT